MTETPTVVFGCPITGCSHRFLAPADATDPTEPDEEHAERLLRRHFRSRHSGEAL